MKKGLLVAILALFTSVALVGCGQKAEEQKQEESTTESSTVENANNEEQPKENAEGNEENKEDEQEEQKPVATLDEQTLEGETAEGTMYGTGKYRITNASDRVVVEWVEELKNKIEYIFENDKLSAVSVATTYANEDQAKTDYETIKNSKQRMDNIKDLKLEGSTIKYFIPDAQLEQIKSFTKQQIFDEQKKELEQLSKVDDIRSDD